MRIAPAFAFVVILGCVAVAAKTPVDTSIFAGADRVHITGNGTSGTDLDTRDIENREQIDALYRLVASESHKWHRIHFDAPLLRWNIEFFRDGKSLGSYGVGANFIEMYPYARTLQPEQQRQVTELLHATSATLRQ